jgi:hypothetical protein
MIEKWVPIEGDGSFSNGYKVLASRVNHINWVAVDKAIQVQAAFLDDWIPAQPSPCSRIVKRARRHGGEGHE